MRRIELYDINNYKYVRQHVSTYLSTYFTSESYLFSRALLTDAGTTARGSRPLCSATHQPAGQLLVQRHLGMAWDCRTRNHFVCQLAGDFNTRACSIDVKTQGVNRYSPADFSLALWCCVFVAAKPPQPLAAFPRRSYLPRRFRTDSCFPLVSCPGSGSTTPIHPRPASCLRQSDCGFGSPKGS